MMRFDIRSLDEIERDDRREARIEAERAALADWLELPQDERIRLLEEADALIPEDVRWIR